MQYRIAPAGPRPRAARNLLALLTPPSAVAAGSCSCCTPLALGLRTAGARRKSGRHRRILVGAPGDGRHQGAHAAADLASAAVWGAVACDHGKHCGRHDHWHYQCHHSLRRPECTCSRPGLCSCRVSRANVASNEVSPGSEADSSSSIAARALLSLPKRLISISNRGDLPAHPLQLRTAPEVRSRRRPARPGVQRPGKVRPHAMITDGQPAGTTREIEMRCARRPAGRVWPGRLAALELSSGRVTPQWLAARLCAARSAATAARWPLGFAAISAPTGIKVSQRTLARSMTCPRIGPPLSRSSELPGDARFIRAVTRRLKVRLRRSGPWPPDASSGSAARWLAPFRSRPARSNAGGIPAPVDCGRPPTQ
jgi:hypothetical protein